MFDFKAFRKSNKMTQEKAAVYFGVDQSFISQIERGKSKIPESFRSKILEDKSLDVSMIPKEILDGNNDNTGDIDVEYVLLLPISAQAGSLNDFIVSVKGSDCERVVSPIKGADFAMTVSGDSMAPEYPSGSQILIKKINENAFIDWGKVYVLDTCNGSVIKTLVPSDKEGYVRCLSINEDPKYAPFDVPTTEIYGFYRVLLCMSVK